MLEMLSGLRVLDITTIVMGPMASQIIADLGADVIKLEAPQGDLSRSSGTLGPNGMGALYANNNRNKRSLMLDLKQEEGREVLEKLLEKTDIVLHNMRPSAAARLGLDDKSVREAHPQIIHCAAIAYGSGGPYAGRPAYDDVIQAAGGLAALPREIGGTPAYVPTILADKVGALHVVYALLAAVIQRTNTGQGCAIEVPMFECLTSFLMNEHLCAATFDQEDAPGYGRLLNPHRRPFATANGWLAVMPYNEGHWRRVLKAIGEKDLPDEPWFSDPAERNRRSADLYACLVQALPWKTSEEWIEILEEIDIPHAKVSGLSELLSDPHLSAKDFFAPSDGLQGRVRSVPLPIQFKQSTSRPDQPPPELGEQSEIILQELGFSEDAIATLKSKGVSC